jgi:hypothetical protein
MVEKKDSKKYPDKEASPSQKGEDKNTSGQQNGISDKDVLEMNLAEGQIVNYFDWKKGVVVLVSMLVLVGIILASAYWGLVMWGERRESEDAFFDKETTKMEKDIDYLRNNAKEAFIYKKKLSLADGLLDDHIYWTNFLNFLEEQTFNDIYYTRFQGDISGDYSILTQAKDVSMIDSQVQRMKDSDIVKSVKVRNISNPDEGTDQGASFDLVFSIDPELFTQ